MKNILIIALLCLVGFLAWRMQTPTPTPTSTSTPTPTPVALTPAEEVDKCLRRSPIPAVELAGICDKYPRLVETRLKNQVITVSGRLKKVLVTGAKSLDLVFEMEGSTQRHLTFSSDLEKSLRAREINLSDGELKPFKKDGHEVCFKGQGGAHFSEMTIATLEATFKYIRIGSVEFEWRQLQWRSRLRR